MDKKTKNTVMLVLIGAIILLTASLAFGWWGETPTPPPPPPPGDQPVATFETKVRMFNPVWADPYIEWVKSEQTGVGSASISNPELLIFPWEGVLKLKVYYPQGQVQVQKKNVKIELNDGLTAAFTWKTKQAGEHTITAELYNKEGNLVDTKTEKVTPEYPIG